MYMFCEYNLTLCCLLPVFVIPLQSQDNCGIITLNNRNNCLYCVTAAKMSNPENYKNAKSIYEFTCRDIKGNEVSLEKYRGHVCIIVNVASQCGYTKNHYAELGELYDQYAESKGLRILAFPCNQFANEEPGTSEEICQFVSSKNVKFDMFEKVNVNGSDAHPLWKYLKHKQGGTLGDFIKWNFTKFIVDKDGQPVERHGPSTSPKDLVKNLEKYW
ncbi:unnamed protein product [Acanthoscelides obtectus]|uniref:Glutathione peroxidase n=1 Tax=Acanthoscelides obtectus TaxID=200917 RepID=A0A9P0P4T6_ACAOB|nr:unnamed protein product [Acanthoscelides obtectus]CAK1657638.1 Phospholipid hydroperoxide glutathione peroxidase [Acanthoscelides obtectus]